MDEIKRLFLLWIWCNQNALSAFHSYIYAHITSYLKATNFEENVELSWIRWKYGVCYSNQICFLVFTIVIHCCIWDEMRLCVRSESIYAQNEMTFQGRFHSELPMKSWAEEFSLILCWILMKIFKTTSPFKCKIILSSGITFWFHITTKKS